MGIPNTSGNYKIYDDSPIVALSYLAINHRGYLFARDTGTYTFSCPYSDDITFLWIGSSALSGWGRTNAALEQDYSGGTSTKTYTVVLTQGFYYPFRILFGNGQGQAQFTFNILGPDGNAISSGTTSNSNYIVKYACDGSTLPFPPFGSGG
jgi:hypothetical protein